VELADIHQGLLLAAENTEVDMHTDSHVAILQIAKTLEHPLKTTHCTIIQLIDKIVDLIRRRAEKGQHTRIMKVKAHT
jgi:hypothetical protein